MTRSMRNSTNECSLPVCNVCAMPFPFLALRLGDLARAAGLRAGDLARAGDFARPRGFGAGDAARLALRVATMVDATRRRREAALNLLQSAAGLCREPRRRAVLVTRSLGVQLLRQDVSGPGFRYARRPGHSLSKQKLREQTSLAGNPRAWPNSETIARTIPAPQFKTLWARFEINYRPASSSSYSQHSLLSTRRRGTAQAERTRRRGASQQVSTAVQHVRASWHASHSSSPCWRSARPAWRPL